MARIKLDPVGRLYQTDIGYCTIAGYDIIRYPSGKVFIRRLYSDLLDRLVDRMHMNVAQDYDNIVVIQGAEGSGKSSLAYSICKAYDPDFDIAEQYVYSVDDLKKKLARGDVERVAWWLDEGSNIANNREWQSQDNRDIVSLTEMMRSKGWTLVICIPRVERLDLYLREFRLRYLLTCEPMKFRGEKKNRGYFSLEARSNSGQMKLCGYGAYDPIPEPDASKYRAIKLAAQEAKIKEVVERPKGGEGYKKKYESERKAMRAAILRAKESGMSREEIMRIWGLSYNQLSVELTRARGEQSE